MPKKDATELAKFISPREMREMFRPRKPAPAAPLPEIQPKRWRMAVEGVRAGKTDDQIVQEFCVPLEVVRVVRAECEQVKKQLAKDPPVEWYAKETAIEGDPEYVPPPPAPEPPAEPTPVPGDGGLN